MAENTQNNAPKQITLVSDDGSKIAIIREEDGKAHVYDVVNGKIKGPQRCEYLVKDVTGTEPSFSMVGNPNWMGTQKASQTQFDIFKNQLLNACNGRS